MGDESQEPTVQSLVEFQTRIRGCSLDEFGERYPHPFLVEWRPRATDEQPFRGSATAEPGVQLPGTVTPESARVVQVRKTPGGAAFRHVTIGRTPNNDIQLADSCISKLHAYLQAPQPGDDRWHLVDVSTYGTAINGEKCRTENPTPLLRATTEAAAPRISFADIHFLFFEEPQALLAALASLMQRGE